MCTELGLPDGMRERSDESNALFWGEVGKEWIGDITKSNQLVIGVVSHIPPVGWAAQQCTVLELKSWP